MAQIFFFLTAAKGGHLHPDITYAKKPQIL
jgi:hypothetical protein